MLMAEIYCTTFYEVALKCSFFLLSDFVEIIQSSVQHFRLLFDQLHMLLFSFILTGDNCISHSVLTIFQAKW
jgi:hypothetical protein